MPLDRFHIIESTLREGLSHVTNNTDGAVMANALAWILATQPDAARRKGEEALLWAQRACSVSNNLDPSHLDTLAAAYAEVGNFEEALRWIARAIQLAQSANQSAEIIASFKQRQQLYQAGQAYHEEQ